MARKRRPPIAASLLQKSREAALNAVQIFNNPLATFKTEVFIVVMSIAWTYLLHAYYHRHGIEYRVLQTRPEAAEVRTDAYRGVSVLGVG